MKTLLTISEFNELIRPLFGLCVSEPWVGYGSAIFLELGNLQPVKRPRQKHPNGESCIALYWDWRIENDRAIICGSSNGRPEIQDHLTQLHGLTISALTLEGIIPEVIIHFSNGLRLRSMAMVSGDPQWNIRLADGKWIACESGGLVLDKGEPSESSPDELEAMEFAETTAKRWNKPIEKPMVGCCRDCKFFVRLNGHFELLDYGVCASPNSPFDGHATFIGNGCSAFSPFPS